jgi:hypothetical protein
MVNKEKRETYLTLKEGNGKTKHGRIGMLVGSKTGGWLD